MGSVSEVYNEDCVIGMGRYPDKFFDLAIVDPPYGLNIAKTGRIGGGNHKGATVRQYKAKDWDRSPPDQDYFRELLRVSKNQIIWGANHFIDLIPYRSPGWIVWDKNKSAGVSFADAELAWSSFDRPVRKFRFTWDGFRQENSKHKEDRIHPTQKPAALYRWLLQNYGKPGDKILDTHLGSGSSRIAAYDLSFDFYGWELDTDYFGDMEARFQAHIAQGSIFEDKQDVELIYKQDEFFSEHASVNTVREGKK